MLQKITSQEVSSWLIHGPKIPDDMGFYHIQNSDGFGTFNQRDIILNYPTVQVLSAIFYSVNEDALTFHYNMPDGYTLCMLASMDLMHVLPSIFNEIAIYYNKMTKEIKQLHLRNLSVKAEDAFTDLLHKDMLNKSLTESFKYDGQHINYLPGEGVIEPYEIINENIKKEPLFLKEINSNYLLSYMLGDSYRSHSNYYSVPLVGYSLDEIENNQAILGLKKYYSRVVVYGRSIDGKWESNDLMVVCPKLY